MQYDSRVVLTRKLSSLNKFGPVATDNNHYDKIGVKPLGITS